MSYRIGKVRYQNFGPFKDVTVDFDQPGLTVIFGVIEGHRGCDSNGSGKSMLFDGPAWALYGRCIRDRYTGDDIVRTEARDGKNVPVRGGTMVSVELKGGPKLVRVERYRSHPKEKNKLLLYVNKEEVSRGTNPETTLAIEEEIGMDFTTFCNSVAFGVREDIKSFFTAPDADRKQILDTMLGLALYAEAEKVARRKARNLTEEVSDYAQKQIELKVAIREKNEAIEKALASDGDDDVELEHRVVEAGIALLHRRIRELSDEEMKIRKEIEDAEEAFDETRQAYRGAEQEYLDQRSQLERKEADVQTQIDNIEGKQSLWKTQVAKINRLKDTCPTCLQQVGKTTREKILKDLNGKIEAADGKLEKLEERRAKFKGQMLELDNNAPVEPVCTEKITLQEERAIICGRADELKRLADAEGVRRSGLARQIKRADVQVGAIRKEIKETAGKLQKIDVKCAELHEGMALAEFWSEAFGNQGLRSFLIEAELPEINRVASQFAQQLLGRGSTVQLSATTRLKTKDAIREKLTVEGSIPGCTNSYAGASKGQRKRMDLSLLLAFRELVAARSAKSFGQLFADEIFDGLDRTGAESVSELLREISEGCPVVLITHDPRIKPDADRVLTVRHNGVFATVA